MGTEPPVDFAAVFVELRRCRLQVSDIAAAISRPISTVNGWERGSTPRHYDGELLIAYWAIVTGFNRDSVPRIGQTRPRSPHPAKESNHGDRQA